MQRSRFGRSLSHENILYYGSRRIHLVSLFLRNNYFSPRDRREIRVACRLEYRAVLLRQRESLAWHARI